MILENEDPQNTQYISLECGCCRRDQMELQIRHDFFFPV